MGTIMESVKLIYVKGSKELGYRLWIAISLGHASYAMKLGLLGLKTFKVIP